MRGFSKFQCELLSQLDLDKKDRNLGTGDLKSQQGLQRTCLATQISKISDKFCHCRTFPSLPSCCISSDLSLFVPATALLQKPKAVTLSCSSAEKCCSAAGGMSAEGQVSREGQPIQNCFANLEMCLNFPSFFSQPFLSPEVWQVVLARPSFLCNQHIPTLKILLKRKYLHVINCLGK